MSDCACMIDIIDIYVDKISSILGNFELLSKLGKILLFTTTLKISHFSLKYIDGEN